MTDKIINKALMIYILSMIFCCFTQSALAITSINNVAWDTTAVKIAVGTYASPTGQCPDGQCNKNQIEQPMMLTSHNINSWKFINLNTDFKHGGHLYQINCLDKTCIASGAFEKEPYNGQNHNRHPIFMITKDAAHTWSIIKNIDNLPEMTDGATPYLSCINEYCSAVGSYQYGVHTFPLLLSSHDYGTSWVNVTNTEYLSAMEGLSAITCADNFCIAGGSYTKDYNEKLPLLIASRDHGQSWSIIQNIVNVPKMQSVNIKKIKCFNGVCLAVGNYDLIHPLLLVSHDEGQSWKFINDLPGITNADRPTSLSIEDIAYSNGSLILVGGSIYHAPEPLPLSLIFVSRDQGKSWSLVRDENSAFGWLKSISCNNNTCVTGGDAACSGHGAACELSLFTSKDNGQSWLPRPSINLDHATNIEIVQCDNRQCTAMGYVGSGFGVFPVSIVSANQGQSWSVQNIFGYPHMLFTDMHFCSMT